MFKIITTVAVMAIGFASSAIAGDKINTMQYTKSGGQADRMITYVEKALGDRFGERIVVDNCAAAKKILENSSTPVLTAWMSELQANQADGSAGACALDQSNFQGYLAAAPWSVCHRTDNTQATLDYLRTGNIRVGVWQSGFYGPQFEAFMNAINPNAKVIPYKKGSQYRAALAAGELDFSISTMAKDGETCPIVLAQEVTGDAVTTGEKFAPNAPYNVNAYSYFLAGTAGLKGDFVGMTHASQAWADRRDNRYHPFLERNWNEREHQWSHLMGK